MCSISFVKERLVSLSLLSSIPPSSYHRLFFFCFLAYHFLSVMLPLSVALFTYHSSSTVTTNTQSSLPVRLQQLGIKRPTCLLGPACSASCWVLVITSPLFA